MRLLAAFTIVLIAFGIYGCVKDPPVEPPVEPPIEEPPAGDPASPRLSYGDSIFYLSGNITSDWADPVTKPGLSGYFKAIPAGLDIDSLNGRINFAQSETGLRYKIYYVSTAGNRIDSTKIVLSGIDYRDSIYEIRATPLAYDTAFPVYNARLENPLPCPDDDDDDGPGDDDDNLCVFDETDLDNDGDDDIDGVIQEKLLIDIKRGFIDMEASYEAGIFGSNPVSGLSKDFTIYYRLRDASNMALNKITVRVYHFRTRQEIPQELLDEIAIRKGLTAQVNSRGRFSPLQNGSLVGRDFFFESRPKRPPVIIIVSQ